MLREVTPGSPAGDIKVGEIQPLSAGHPKPALVTERLSQVSDVASKAGHSLYQEMFFTCAVKRVADLLGSSCIYVEIVVDRDSGVSFAKVYSSRNAANAVDILATRVLPFFRRQGVAIKEIHTRKAPEYCGLTPVHAYEAFLAEEHIRHLPTEHFGPSCNHICKEFYRHLLKNFFPAALRRKFPLSLSDLQKDLDAFVEAYNATPIGHRFL